MERWVYGQMPELVLFCVLGRMKEIVKVTGWGYGRALMKARFSCWKGKKKRGGGEKGIW